MRGSRLSCFLLITSLVLTGCGGGGSPAEGSAEETGALLDPVEEEETLEPAAYRNLYDAKVYAGRVSLATVEYSFPAGDVVFDHYAVMLGDTVKKGQTLACADTKELDARIEELEKQIAEAQEEQRRYLEDTEEQLYEPEQEALRLQGIVETYEQNMPEKYESTLPVVSGGNAAGDGKDTGDVSRSGTVAGNGEVGVDGSGGEKEPPVTEAYAKWEEEYKRFNGQYRLLDFQNDTIRLQMEQRTQLYELDHAYMQEQLKALKEEKGQYVITSSVDGEVVAMKFGEPQSVDEEDPYATTAPRSFLKSSVPVPRGTGVVAVGDMGHKVVRCDPIRAMTVESAQEVYVFLDGKRYEVEYVKTEEERYSEFSFAQEAEAAGLEAGATAFVVVVAWSREQVLTVPVNAVRKDGEDPYVLTGDGGVITPVTTGMSDGVYVEILDGLSEGEGVVAEPVMKAGAKRSVLAIGSPANTVDYKGVLFYPATCLVKNPVKYGTAYFEECRVEQYQQVEAGDVIATIHVQADEILLMEYERKRDRLQERLEDLVGQGEEENKIAIREQREAIEEIEEEMAKWEQDGAVTEILAPTAGFILQKPNYSEGDILGAEEAIAEIAVGKEGEFYLAVPGAGAEAGCGSEEITVYYLGADNGRHPVNTRIVSVPSPYLGDSLVSDCALAVLPREVSDQLLSLYSGVAGTGYREEVTVNVPLHPVKDVLLVPTEAVKVVAGQPYVFVAEKDGSVVARSFIAAGSGYGYYWVIDGLAEGMEICL